MENIQKHWWLFLLEGIVFIFLGMIAIAVPQISTLGFELFIGALLLIGGVVQSFRAFKFWGEKLFWSSFASGLISLFAGGLFLFYPKAGILTLTMLLIAYLSFEGISSIVFATFLRPAKNWGIVMFSGILSLSLAFLLMIGLPYSAIWAIGLILGVKLLVSGFSMVLTGIGFRGVTSTPAT